MQNSVPLPQAKDNGRRDFFGVWVPNLMYTKEDLHTYGDARAREKQEKIAKEAICIALLSWEAADQARTTEERRWHEAVAAAFDDFASSIRSE